MKHALLKTFLIFIIFFLPLKSFSAETTKLRYLQSVYSDDKGVGLKQPEGVACNEKSLLIAADTGNGRILRYTYEERTLKGGTEIRVPQLSNPIRVQINSKGDIFVLDGTKRRIMRLSSAGELKGYLDPEGVPSPLAFVPRSFKIDSNDNIYILDVFSGRVLLLNLDGKYQNQIPFPKVYGFFSDLSVDASGSVLLIDSVKNRVFSAARGTNSFIPLTKSLKEYLNFPTSITNDGKRTIYIVDQNGSGIVILGPDGSYLSRQLTMGWNEGLLRYPSQMCVNEKGEVFIADSENSRIQIFAVVK